MGYLGTTKTLGLLLFFCYTSGEIIEKVHLSLIKTSNTATVHIPGTVCNTQLPAGDQICTCGYDNHGLVVNCYDKKLHEIPKNLPTGAVTLYLHSNKITEIKHGQLNHLIHLRFLHLSKNKIELIENNAFRNLRRLQEIHLDDNKLKQIVASTFYHLHNTTIIYLGGNPIEIISEDAFKLLRKIFRVELHDIKLQCNCDALYLRQWANATSVHLENAKCKNLGDQSLWDVPVDQFGGCSPVPPKQKCQICNSAGDIKGCFANGTSSECPDRNDICWIARAFLPDGTISSRCFPLNRCLDSAAASDAACNEGEHTSCSWCCVGAHCDRESTFQEIATAGRAVPNFVHVLKFDMQFKMDREYHQDLNNETTEKFLELQEEIQSELDLSFVNLEGEHTSFVEKFSPGSVVVHGRIESVVDAGADVISVRDGLHDALLDVANQLDVDPKSVVTTHFSLCSRETTISSFKGTIHWPTTKGGMFAKMPCPEDSSLFAIRHCDRILQPAIRSEWIDPDLSACPYLDDRLPHLENLTLIPITQDTVGIVCQDLNNLTQDFLTFHPIGVQLVTVTVENVVSSDAFLDGQSGTELLNSISNMVQVPSEILGSAQSQYNSVQRLAWQTERFGQRFDKTKLTEEQIIISSEMGVAVGAYASYQSRAVTFEASIDDTIEIRVKKSDLLTTNSRLSTASIVLPPSVFDEISNEGSPNVQFTIHDSPVLFEVMANVSHQKSHLFNARPDNNQENRMRMNSRVVSVSFGNVTVNNTADPIEITLSHDIKDATDPECTFWSFQEGRWSEAGCTVHEFVAGRYTVCHCNHLTNFALIMDIFGRGGDLPEGHQKALSILSYVGMAFSILGLSITLITYLAFRNLRRDKPARILINLCCALLALCISFVLNTQPNIIQNDVACKMLAGMLHYFTLSSLCWMGVEGFYMYLALVRVFQTYFTHFMAKCCLVGWGIPSVIVIITYAVSPNNYVNMENICWLERNAFYGAFLAPVTTILVFNGIVFGMVMYQLRQVSKKPEPAMNKKSSLLLHLKGTMSIMSLLGLTWLFAFFSIGGAGIVFNYLFVIFNGSQGLFIFLFYCVFKKDVQVAWLAVVRTRGKTVPDSGSTSRVYQMFHRICCFCMYISHGNDQVHKGGSGSHSCSGSGAQQRPGGTTSLGSSSGATQSTTV